MDNYPILIVDDEPTFTSALNYYFVLADYGTILPHADHEALGKIALKPDLVVLDMMLPDREATQFANIFVDRRNIRLF